MRTSTIAGSPSDRHVTSVGEVEGSDHLDSLRDLKSGDSCFHSGPLLGGHSVVAVPPASIPS